MSMELSLSSDALPLTVITPVTQTQSQTLYPYFILLPPLESNTMHGARPIVALTSSMDNKQQPHQLPEPATWHPKSSLLSSLQETFYHSYYFLKPSYEFRTITFSVILIFVLCVGCAIKLASFTPLLDATHARGLYQGNSVAQESVQWIWHGDSEGWVPIRRTLMSVESPQGEFVSTRDQFASSSSRTPQQPMSFPGNQLPHGNLNLQPSQGQYYGPYHQGSPHQQYPYYAPNNARAQVAHPQLQAQKAQGYFAPQQSNGYYQYQRLYNGPNQEISPGNQQADASSQFQGQKETSPVGMVPPSQSQFQGQRGNSRLAVPNAAEMQQTDMNSFHQQVPNNVMFSQYQQTRSRLPLGNFPLTQQEAFNARYQASQAVTQGDINARYQPTYQGPNVMNQQGDAQFEGAPYPGNFPYNQEQIQPDINAEIPFHQTQGPNANGMEPAAVQENQDNPQEKSSGFDGYHIIGELLQSARELIYSGVDSIHALIHSPRVANDDASNVSSIQHPEQGQYEDGPHPPPPEKVEQNQENIPAQEAQGTQETVHERAVDQLASTTREFGSKLHDFSHKVQRVASRVTEVVQDELKKDQARGEEVAARRPVQGVVPLYHQYPGPTSYSTAV